MPHLRVAERCRQIHRILKDTGQLAEFEEAQRSVGGEWPLRYYRGSSCDQTDVSLLQQIIAEEEESDGNESASVDDVIGKFFEAAENGGAVVAGENGGGNRGSSVS